METVESKRFDEITDQDAQREGGQLAEDLKAGLREHYSQIRDEDLIDVVSFRISCQPV